MNASMAFVGGLVLVGLVGCAGKGERIDMAIPGKYAGGTSSAGGLRAAVLPFEDKRGSQAHLGTRTHFFGGNSYFDLPSGSVADASAQALVEYLNRHGWQASLARTAGANGADVTIAGTVQDLSIDAAGGFLHTDLSAKNTLLLHVTNHSDQSTVRERITGSGTDQVLWFEPSDAQALTTELFEKNFQRFLADVKIDGRAVRLK